MSTEPSPSLVIGFFVFVGLIIAFSVGAFFGQYDERCQAVKAGVAAWEAVVDQETGRATTRFYYKDISHDR